MKKIEIPKTEEGNWEYLFHKTSKEQNRLLLMNNLRKEKCIDNYIGHRAIGIMYHLEH